MTPQMYHMTQKVTNCQEMGALQELLIRTAWGNSWSKGLLLPGKWIKVSPSIQFADRSNRGDSGHKEAKNGNGTTTSGQYIPFLNDVEQTRAWIHDSIAIITNSTRDITSVFY